MSLKTVKGGAAALAVLALALLGGCGSGGKTAAKSGESGNGGETKAAGGGIPIGVVLEKTGGLQDWGRDSERGMFLALEHLKGQGGIEISLDIRDNNCKPDQSASEFINLVSVKNVLAVLGAVASSDTRAMKEQANKYKVPLITHASTNVQLTKDTEWLYRICFDDEFQGAVCARFAWDSLKAKKAIVVTDAAQDYSRGLTASFTKTYTELGGTVVEELTYQTGDKIFTSQVGKLQASEIECVFTSGYAPEVGLLLKTAREAGFDKPFLGGDGLSMEQFYRIAGAQVGTGVYICDHAHPDDPDPKVQKFVTAYKAKFAGATPGSMAFLGYDAIFAIHDALVRAKAKGELTRDSVREAIGSIQDLDLVTGRITMGADHEVKKRAVVLKYQPDGSFKFAAEVKPE
ncbi:MAG: ABC transporter substrate-binding protein [Planctomycetota bacterium]|nr:ABC transporter substrate-binding protein [Planctomycetota bacterium]